MSEFREFMDYNADLADQMEESSRQRKTGGGGGYADMWRPPKPGEGEPTPIVLFQGEYTMELQYGKETLEMRRPFYVYFEHFYATKEKGIACSAGLTWERHDDGEYGVGFGRRPCVACYHIEEGAKGISRRKMQAFNAILLEWYHIVDSKNENPKTKKPYKEPAQCTGKKCRHCKAGIEKKFGRRIFWPLGRNHSDQLNAFQRSTLRKQCRCGGKITTVAFTCKNCNAIVRDLEEDPPAKGELKSLRSSVYECPECRSQARLKEEIECKKGCKIPNPLTLWDVVLEPQRVGEGTASSVQIANWGLIEPDLKKSIEDQMKPFDFSKVQTTKILDMTAQARRLELPNPYNDEEEDGVVSGCKVWAESDDD